MNREELEPITPITIEDDYDMVKQLDFTEVTSPNANLVNIKHIRNMGYYNNKYYFVEGDYLYSITSITGSSTIELSIDYDLNAESVVTRTFDDNICSIYTTTFGGTSRITTIYSTNGGSTYTSRTAMGLEDFYGAGSHLTLTDAYAIDIFQTATDTNWGVFVVQGYLVIVDLTAPGTVYYAQSISTLEGVYGGYYESGVYHCIAKDDSGDLAYFDYTVSTTTWSNEGDVSMTAPATFASNEQQYWKQSGNYYILDQDHLYYSVDGTNWSNYSASGSNNGIIWGYNSDDEYIIEYLIFDEYLFRIYESGGHMRVMDFTYDSNCGFDDFIIDGTNNKIYQAGYVAKHWMGTITTKPYLAPIGNILINVKPNEDLGYILADDDDNLIYQGKLKTAKYDLANYNCSLISLIDTDLMRKMTGSFVDKSEDYIIKYFIDNDCDFIKYGASTIAAGGGSLTLDIVDKPFSEILRLMDSSARKLSSIRPDFTLYWDTMTASGKTIDSSSTSFQSAPIPETVYGKISHIKLFGGWNPATNKKFESEDFAEPNYGYYEDWFPLKKTQAALDDLRDELLDNWNQSFQRFMISPIDEGQLDYGTTLTLTVPNHSITTDTYYILSSIYHINSRICKSTVSSVFWVPGSLTKETSNLEQYVTDLIEATKGARDYDIAELMAIGSANARRVQCIYEITSQPGKAKMQSQGSIANIDATYQYFCYGIPLDETRGSYSLYISEIQVNVVTADATDFVTNTFLQAYNGASASNLVNNETDRTSAGTYTVSFTAENCSAYEKVVVNLKLTCATAAEIEIAGVKVKYYYA